MKRIVPIMAAVAVLTFAVHRASADPQLLITANHLGGGLVQYSFQVDNDLGGNVAAQISVQGNIHQIPSVFFADAFPNGGVSLSSQADTAGFDDDYNNAGGKQADSWWDDVDYSTPNPPFGGHLGGAVGNTLFQYSAGTFGLALGVPNLTFLGQIVINDPNAAANPTGPLDVVDPNQSALPTAALFSIINPGDAIENSSISADGIRFPIIGDFAVVGIPEPSTLALLGIGLISIGAMFRRRR